MKRITILTGVLLLASPVLSADGMLGLTVVDPGTTVSVRIAVPEGDALTGVRWFHNDGTLPFPEIRLAPAVDGEPYDAASAAVFATNVTGGSTAWAEAEFGCGVVSGSGAVDVHFILPESGAFIHEGAGGGAGIGYDHVPAEHEVWLSADGEDWWRLHGDYRLCVEPVFSEADVSDVVLAEGVKTLVDPDTERSPSASVPAGITVSPNPFNPKTSVGFRLDAPVTIRLAVFGLRGEHVKTIAEGRYSAGFHVVDWDGRDESGRRSASGTYLAVLEAGGKRERARMVLVR